MMMCQQRRFKKISGFWAPVTCRRVLLVALATLSAAAASAGTGRDEDKAWAIQIVEKHIDPANGTFSVTVKNEGTLTVTAFGVALVSSDESGRGSTIVRSEDFIPGQGIAPGASFLISVPSIASQLAHGPLPVHAAGRHFEIRSDNSVVGDQKAAEAVFAQRTAALREARILLSVVHPNEAVTGRSSSIEEQLREVVGRGDVAQEVLSNRGLKSNETPDLDELAAVARAGQLATQALAKISKGESVSEVLGALTAVLRSEIDVLSRNLRTIDLKEPER